MLRKVKGAFAYLRIDLKHGTRPMYQALAALMERRAFGGNPVNRLFLDGLLLILVGALLLCLPIVWVLAAPLQLLRLSATRDGREDLDLAGKLVEEGRVNWSTGEIADPKEPENGQEPPKE